MMNAKTCVVGHARGMPAAVIRIAVGVCLIDLWELSEVLVSARRDESSTAQASD
jgi:hypothetical protein